jgi:hypothetical protein
LFFRIPSFEETARRIIAAANRQLGIKKKKTTKSSLNVQIRNSDYNYRWRQQVLKRDGRKCVLCGSKKRLEVDHIKPLSYLIKKHKIMILEQAFLCQEFWDVSNGRVLCKPCHKKTDTYAGKSKGYKER